MERDGAVGSAQPAASSAAAPAASDAADAADGRPETKAQRSDRNFTELLQELRVVQTGVQILFGFLLTVPFSVRFATATAFEVAVYATTVVACALAVALLVAPVSYHRQVFGQGRKAELVRTGDRLARCGLVCLLVAMAGAILLIMNEVAGLAVAVALTAAVAVVYLGAWYVLPWYSSRERGREPGAGRVSSR